MPSVLAIISKAVFEKLAARTVAVGDVIDIDRYTSSNAAFNGCSWHFADLIRTDKMAKAVVDEVASWDSGPKPKQRVLEVIAALGPLCVPHLEKAIAKKPPQKALLAAGLKLAAKS
jgi:hypothetical protein